MGLYDKKLDWYDFLVPFSNIPAGHSVSPLVSDTDILDAFGVGTQRRQQEFNASEAEKERQFNALEAQKQRDYETQMANTSYQRAVKDLKDSGLNPYMVYGAGGTPAPTPTGSSASAGSGARSGIQNNMNLISQVSGLLNSVNNSRALDHQINKSSRNVTTQRMYDSVGNLISTLVKIVK